MTGRIIGNNGFLLNPSQEYKEQLVNELIRLTSVVSVAVVSRVVQDPPPVSLLTTDSYYIVPTGATGVWFGKTNQIAYPLIGIDGKPNGNWGFWTPFSGLKVSLISGSELFFDGTNWQVVSGSGGTGGDMSVANYGGSAFGVVAKADQIVGNPSDNTFYGKESGTKGFFAFFPKVLSTPLTGLSATTGGAIATTDNVLQAFGKVQKQISDITGVTDGDKGDILVSNSGATWTVETGTTANSIVRLDNTAKLPAVDGSQLTNLPTGASPLTSEQIRDSLATLTDSNRLDASAIKNLPTALSSFTNDTNFTTLNAVANVGYLTSIPDNSVTNAKLASGIDAAKITTGTLPTARLDTGTTANKIIQLDSQGKLPAVDGSQLINLPAVGGGTGVTDGDKGDVIVSNSGTTWTIDNQAVTYSKLQQTNSGNIVLGKPTNGSGTIAEIPIGVGANNLIRLDNQGKLPAVDGSQLTNLPGLTASQVRDSLSSLTDNNRLDASAIKNLPTGGGGITEEFWAIAIFALTSSDSRLEGTTFPKTLTLPPFPTVVRINKISGLINSLSNGSAILSIQNNTINISGLSDLNCTTTVLPDQLATANNIISAGGRLRISFTSITALINLSFRIDYTENP